MIQIYEQYIIFKKCTISNLAHDPRMVQPGMFLQPNNKPIHAIFFFYFEILRTFEKLQVGLFILTLKSLFLDDGFFFLSTFSHASHL